MSNSGDAEDAVSAPCFAAIVDDRPPRAPPFPRARARLAPSREKLQDELAFARRIRNLPERKRDGERHMIALGARGRGAPVCAAVGIMPSQSQPRLMIFPKVLMATPRWSSSTDS